MFTRTVKEFIHLIITVAFLGVVLNLSGCAQPTKCEYRAQETCSGNILDIEKPNAVAATQLCDNSSDCSNGDLCTYFTEESQGNKGICLPPQNPKPICSCEANETAVAVGWGQYECLTADGQRLDCLK